MIAATDGDGVGFAYAFERASGEVRWKHSFGSPAPSDVVVLDELVYVNTEGSGLVALELATGEERWSFPPLEGPRVGDSVTSPVVAGDRVVITTRDGNVVALDGHDGRVIWRRWVGSAMTSPVAGGDRIYVGLENEDRVIALAVATGAPAGETYAAGPFAHHMPPVVGEGGVLLATNAILESWTGDLDRHRWEFSAPAELSRSPVAWNDRIVAGTTRGQVVGCRAVDGHPAPEIELGGVVTGLVGYEDVLYVGTQKGTLYAVRP